MHHSVFQRLFSYPLGVGIELDLNKEAERDFPDPDHNPLLDPGLCERWIANLQSKEAATFSWGGYLEDRSWLWRGSYLQADRAVHLGVDVNFMYPGHVIRCPVEHRILDVWTDPDRKGGWGTRVLVETKRGYVIFAHLAHSVGYEISRWYAPYRPVGELGSPSINGGWFTHLHLQGLRDPGQLEGLDGYGAATVFNQLNYPNPLYILGLTDDPNETS